MVLLLVSTNKRSKGYNVHSVSPFDSANNAESEGTSLVHGRKDSSEPEGLEFEYDIFTIWIH